MCGVIDRRDVSVILDLMQACRRLCELLLKRPAVDRREGAVGDRRKVRRRIRVIVDSGVGVRQPCSEQIDGLKALRRDSDSTPVARLRAYFDGEPGPGGVVGPALPECVPDLVVPECVRAGEVPARAHRNAINEDWPVMLLLVEHGEDGCTARGVDDVDHNVLGVVFEEEPGFLPGEGFGQRVGESLGSDACFAIGDAAYKGLEANERGLTTAEHGFVIVNGCTRDYCRGKVSHWE